MRDMHLMSLIKRLLTSKENVFSDRRRHKYDLVYQRHPLRA
jgi:hypothetical protein